MRRPSRPDPRRAVVLLSGGLDSATVLYDARARGLRCHCLVFRYGQRHAKEVRCAVRLAREVGCPYTIVPVRLPWEASALTDRRAAVPSRPTAGRLPATYVPGRNTLFIAYALSFAETIGAGTVLIGANAVDYSGYPDCRPGYYAAFNRVLRELGTGVTIVAPLIRLTKAQIIRRGTRLGVPYGKTWSCYRGGARPCGTCDSCRFRAKGFTEAGIKEAC